MTNRVYNFSAGPAALPLSVLKRAQAEFLNWQELGMSVLEISHRSKAFEKTIEKTIFDLRSLLNIPSNYHVLFLPGGGQTQFAAIPMNFLGEADRADYVLSGIWGKKALTEAQKYCQVNLAASNESLQFQSLIPFAKWQCDEKAAYLHYVSNETIEGLEYLDEPLFSSTTTIIADMSSNILSKPLNIEKYGVIYAGVQKNIAPAGLAIAIVRDDLLKRKKAHFLPATLDYSLQFENNSCYNTLPVFQVYMAGLMFDWLKSEGGLGVMAARNQEKARCLYDAIDASDFYINQVDPLYRSRMNVVFQMKKDGLLETFLKAAESRDLANLKGHRLVGGVRASLYNAMPLEGVRALIDFMHDFEKQYA
jgi:phosphoserine aminotransferase